MERSAVAIDSLEAIVFASAAAHINTEGTHIPLWSSPRAAVAKLGPRVYDRLFSPAHSQEDVGEQSMVQFIVTTTASPPGEMRTEPW